MMHTTNTAAALWSTAAGQWARYGEPACIPLYEYVLQQLAPDEEQMLLDAGCGAGFFLSMAAASGALLHGVDAAKGMIDLARSRVPGAALLVEDLQALPFIDGTFDVTGLNAFQYAVSPEAALSEARRVVKRHGKVVIATWGREEDCDAGHLFAAMAALLPAHRGAAGPFAMSEAGKVEAICHKIGLRINSRTSVFCPWTFPSDVELQQVMLSNATGVQAVALAGEAAVRTALRVAAQPFHLADDVYYLKNQFIVYITEKI